jgi:preprotein translocase subunit SecG
MSYVIIVLALIVSILILIVLVQKSKGGGLAANFTGPTNVMGVRQTSDFLEKGTWVLAGALLLLSVASTMYGASTRVSDTDADQVEANAQQDLPQAAPQQNSIQEVPQGGAQPAEQAAEQPAEQPSEQPVK